MNIYALVDCNHFYVSCERVFRPDLENKPVAVLSNNDGCIVALSPEVKKLGIKRGTPWFKIKHLIRKHNIEIFSSNYTLYGDLSLRVMSILERFTPDLEVYSIDEAFLDLTGIAEHDLIEYGKKIKKAVLKCTGIPVSIGIAPTKTLAKAANILAKKNKSNLGVFVIDNEQVRRKVLEAADCKNIWGIGYRYAEKLKRNGINNAWQLTQVDDNWILKNMTVIGLRMVNELRGKPHIENIENNNISCINKVKEENSDYTCFKHRDGVRDSQKSVSISKVQGSDLLKKSYEEPRKSIVSSRSFGKPVTDINELGEALSSYCITALYKLRQQNSAAKRITIFLTTNPFKDEPQYANYREAILPGYSAYPPDFCNISQEILKAIYRKGYKYKKVGVMITEIIRQEDVPQDIFISSYPDDYRSDVMKCVDNINSKWGQGTLTFAGAGIKQNWRMRRDLLSPKYTTSFAELPVVKANRCKDI